MIKRHFGHEHSIYDFCTRKKNIKKIHKYVYLSTGLSFGKKTHIHIIVIRKLTLTHAADKIILYFYFLAFISSPPPPPPPSPLKNVRISPYTFFDSCNVTQQKKNIEPLSLCAMVLQILMIIVLVVNSVWRDGGLNLFPCWTAKNSTTPVDTVNNSYFTAKKYILFYVFFYIVSLDYFFGVDISSSHLHVMIIKRKKISATVCDKRSKRHCATCKYAWQNACNRPTHSTSVLDFFLRVFILNFFSLVIFIIIIRYSSSSS